MNYLIALLLVFSGLGYAGVMNDKSALHQWVFEIRDPKTEPQEFRNCLTKIGEYLAYEVMGDLGAKEASVETLTGAVASHRLRTEKPVLVTILRAGIPLLQGVQQVFPEAEVGFLGMARNEETLEPKTDYVALPEMKGKTVILVDTMLATGGSFLDAIRIVEELGAKRIFVLCAIASQAGIERVLKHNGSIEIYPAAIDPTLNDRGYIVPGLGDAGDRSYGRKR
jgi:uracil phosphoribosyltransferase